MSRASLLQETALWMDTVNLALCLFIYEVCNDCQFEFASGSDFVNFMNLKPTSRPVTVRPKENLRVCYMVFSVSQAIRPRERGRLWAEGFLKHCGISKSYYDKHRSDVCGKGATEENRNFRKAIDKAIEIVRNTAEESEVVPNLMIGFGIDEVQAEYVAEIKLRHLNREYILKRTEEIEELEDAIADLQDILKRPARINRIIMQELGDVAKKYGKPRRCEILYEIPADTADEPDEQVPDYPVHLFFTRDGYFKKITPQSLRMSGEQKLKDGDEVLFTCESTNSAELLFFTNHHQVYKSHAYDFGDSKASVLGDYVASSLGMEEGEVPLYMVVTPDYKGWMLFFFQNGKCAKVPLSSYETKQNRRKLLKAYSDKEELACMRYLPAETELAIFTTNGRLLLAGSALIPEKATRDSAGVNVVTLKKNAKIARVTLADGLELGEAHRYRVRTLPAAGAILRADDSAEQLTL